MSCQSRELRGRGKPGGPLPSLFSLSRLTTIGATWTTGLIFLIVAALFGLLPDPGEARWGGALGRVVEAIAAASWFMVPLLVATLVAAFGRQSRMRDPRVGIPILAVVGFLLSPYPWRDPHGIVPVLVIAATPWLARPLVEYVERTSHSTLKRASWILAAAVLVGGVGVILSALRGVMGGAPGMRWAAMSAEVGYFTATWGLALGAFTFGVTLVTAILVLIERLRARSI